MKKAGDEVRSLRGRQDGVSICGHIKARLLSACWLDGANSGRLCRRGRRKKNGGGGGGDLSSSLELGEVDIRKFVPRKKETEEEHKRKDPPSLVDTATATTSSRSLEKDFTWELAVPNEKGEEEAPQQPNNNKKKKKTPE